MFNQRDLEGYLEIDHRESPGFTLDEAFSVGLKRIAPDVGKGKCAKVGTRNCSHCEAMVIMNPMRTRERARCWKCWGYLCDRCKVIQVANGGACKPFKQVIDEFVNQAAKGVLINGT